MNIRSRYLAIAGACVLSGTLLAPASSRAADYAQYSGAQLYARFCASCHGKTGVGDGTVAPSLGVLVPDLTEISRRHRGAFPEEQIMRIIDGRQPIGPHGSRTMPVWGYEFQSQGEWTAEGAQQTNEIVRRLAQFIRSLQKE